MDDSNTFFSLDLQQPQTTRRSPRTVSNFFAGYYTKPMLHIHELVSNTFYKIHFHNENRLIETESSSSGDSWLYSTHFSSGLIPYINHFHYENNVTQFSKWKSTCWWLAISVATNGGNTFFHWRFIHHYPSSNNPINTPQFLEDGAMDSTRFSYRFFYYI